MGVGWANTSVCTMDLPALRQNPVRVIDTGRKTMILFLDFDGVLHSSEVYLVRRQPELRAAEGMSLFQHTPILIEVLATLPDIKIVLSTSWVARLGFDRAKAYLPEALQTRVIGATWHRHAGLLKNDWFLLSRYVQIESYVRRHRLTHWLAIDDDAEGWPAMERHHLVHCKNPQIGISDEVVYSELAAAIAHTARYADNKLFSIC